MNITKCDMCHKIIESDSQVSVGYLSAFPHFAFCLKCAKPVVAFLKKNNLLGEE